MKKAGSMFGSLKLSSMSLSGSTKSANTSQVDTPSASASKSRIRTQSVSSSMSTSGSLSSIISKRSKSRTHLQINTLQGDILTVDPKTPSPVEPKKLNSLQKAVYAGDVKKVKALVADRKRDVNKMDTFHGFSALHVAAEENMMEIAEVLLDPGKAVSGKDAKKIAEFATSPLKKCSVDALNQENRTPLTLAAIRGHLDMIKLLIEHGANPDSADLLGCTSLHYAMLTGNKECLKFLISHSTTPDHIDKSGLSYLQHAIRIKDESLVETLIDFGVPVNHAAYEDKSTALHLAAEHGLPTTVKLLLQRGADPSLLDVNQKSALSRISRQHNNQDLIDLLTVKMLEKEAREELGKKSFLEFKEASRGTTPVPAEETAIETVDFVGGNKRVQQGKAREGEIEYTKKKVVKGKKKGMRNPGDPLELESMYLSEDDPQSSLDLSDPSNEISLSEESDSEMFSALGLSKADRAAAKKASPKSISSESLSSIREQSEDGSFRLSVPIAKQLAPRSGLEVTTADDDLESEIEDFDEEEADDEIVELQPQPGSSKPKKPSSRRSTSSNATGETDLLDALGIDTEEITGISQITSSIKATSKSASQNDTDSSPSLSISSESSKDASSRSGKKSTSSKASERILASGSDKVSSKVSDKISSKASDKEMSSVASDRVSDKEISSKATSSKVPSLKPRSVSIKKEDHDHLSNTSHDLDSFDLDSDVDAISEIPSVHHARDASPLPEAGSLQPHTLDEMDEQSKLSGGLDNFDKSDIEESPVDIAPRQFSALPELPLRQSVTQPIKKERNEDSPYLAELLGVDDHRLFFTKLDEVTTKLDGTHPIASLLQKIALATKQRDVSHIQTFAVSIKQSLDGQPVQSLDPTVEDVLQCVRKKIGEVEDMKGKEVTDLKARIQQVSESLQTEKKTAEESSKAKESVITQMTVELENLNREKLELKTQFSESQKKVEETISENKSLSLDFKQLETVTIDLKKQIDALKADNEILRQDTSNQELQNLLQDMKSAHADELKKFEDQITDLKTSNAELTLQLDTAKSSHAASQTEFTQKLTEIHGNFDATKKLLSAEIERKSAFQRETRYLRQLLKGYGASVESLHMLDDESVTSDVEDDENPFKVYCTQLEEDCLELQKRLAHEAEDRATLERQIEEARFHSEEVSDELQELAGLLKMEKKATLACEERLAIVGLELEAAKVRAAQLEGVVKEKDTDGVRRSEELRNAMMQMEKLHRNVSKLQTDLNAVMEEKSSLHLQIESRNSQIEALRTQIKEVVMKQNSERGTRTEDDGLKKEISEDIIQYYENEIKLLHQQFDEEKEMRGARDEEYKKVLQSLCELEEKLVSLKTLYEKQLAVCSDLETAKLKAEADLELAQTDITDQQKRIRELEVAAIKHKTQLSELESNEAELKQRSEKDLHMKKEEIEVLRKTIRQFEKEKFDQEMLINTTKLQLEEKACRVIEADKRADQLRIESDGLGREVKELKRQLREQKEDYESVKDEKHHEVDGLRQSVKEKERKLEHLVKETSEIERRLQDTQNNFEKKLRESDNQRITLQSELDHATSEITRLTASLTHTKSRCTSLETALTTLTEDRDTIAVKLQTLTKHLEAERKKSERFFKSTDNLRSKLSSFVDLSPPTDHLEINEMRRGIPVGKSSSTIDISGNDAVSALRDIRSFINAEVRAVESRLGVLGEELGRDLTRIASLQREISADVEMESEIKELIIKFLHSQTTRVSEARGSIQTSKITLSSASKEVETGLDGVREAFEKETRRLKMLKEETERSIGEREAIVEEMKKRKGVVQQELTESLARCEVLEEEKEGLIKKVKEVGKEVRVLKEKMEGFEDSDTAVKELKGKLQKTEGNLQMAEAKIEQLEESLIKVSKEKEKIVGQMQSEEKGAQARDKLVEEIKKQLEEAVAEKTNLELRIQVAEKALAEVKSEAQKRSQDLELKVKELQGDLVSLKLENSELKRNSDTVASLKSESSDLKRNSEHLQQKLTEATDTNRTLQRQLVDSDLNFTRRRTELEGELYAATQMRTKLESENHRLEDQVRHLRDAVDESKARISQLEKAQSYLEQERRDVSSAGQVQEALMKRLKTELEDALGIQRRLELERNSLREELSSRSRMDLHKHDTYGDSAERTSWDAEKKKLVEELEKRTGSLAQAERDSLAVAKQLKEATTKLHHLQTKFDDSDIPIPVVPPIALKAWQEEKKTLEKNLEEERNHRRDVEMRSDRVRRQLEEEIASLTSARKRLEERESFTEHQRRASDMKVHELQDIIESERGTKHKLREELHNIMITVRNLEGENSAIKRKLESQESPELSKAMRARMGGLEEENMALKSRLQMAESRLIGIEARAKASFDDKLRKVAVRLEEQSRERERIEKAREQNEQDMRERYERHIQKLVTELDAVRRVVDMHGSSVTGAVPVGVGARRSAWQQESHDLKDELFRQVEALKRSNQRLEAKFRGFEAISVNSMMDDIPRAAAAGRDGRSSPYSKKLRFAELLNEDDLCMKRVPNRISKSTRSPREAEDEEERPAAAPPSRRKRSTSRERREQVTSARTESAKAGTHRRPIITPTDQDDEDD